MSRALASRRMTVTEFDAFTDAQLEDTLWELVDGQIVAMTNPTARHGRIVANVGTALKPAADRKGCDVNFGGFRVQATADGSGVDKTIPDLTVTCGTVMPDHTFTTEPTIVVEVLSRSTMDYDRGAKLDFYKSLPSLRDVVLVYRSEMRVEHFRRERDAWVMSPLVQAGEELALTGLPFAIPLAAIYAGTGLP